MIVRSWLGIALVAASTVWSGAARAQGASPPPEGDSVAVLPLELIGNVPAGRSALEAAVVRGLTMFTGTTVEATQTSARLIAAGAKLPCGDAACWTAAGKAAGARHLVAGRVERKGPNFEVQFRLLEGASGRLLATETNKCEAADCSVAELTRQTVRELARTMLSGASGGKGTPPGATASGAVATADGSASGAASGIPEATSAAATVESQASVDSGPSVARRLLPYTAIAAGVGVAGAGVYLMSQNNSCDEKTRDGVCNTYRETMWAGVTLTGLGGALLATGVVVAITDHLDARERTVVLIGPRSLMLRGRF
jgi:TolB-like protein